MQIQVQLNEQEIRKIIDEKYVVGVLVEVSPNIVSNL